ncbi:hypothetical protein LWE69_12050 [Paenibacillus sp. UKAQ_18]|nr:hypothetical protein [Paenibacillus sp. UKAQ_18]
MLDGEVESYIDLRTSGFKKSSDENIQDVEQDFSNALDVLECFLQERNYNLITELQDVFERKTDLILAAYKSGLIDGVNYKKEC